MSDGSAPDAVGVTSAPLTEPLGVAPGVAEPDGVAVSVLLVDVVAVVVAVVVVVEVGLAVNADAVGLPLRPFVPEAKIGAADDVPVAVAEGFGAAPPSAQFDQFACERWALKSRPVTMKVIVPLAASVFTVSEKTAVPFAGTSVWYWWLDTRLFAIDQISSTVFVPGARPVSRSEAVTLYEPSL
jgi:hypothetical protein